MNQKGFAPILIILGIVLLVAVAGGAYYFGQLSVKLPAPPPQVPASIPQTSISPTQSLTPSPSLSTQDKNCIQEGQQGNYFQSEKCCTGLQALLVVDEEHMSVCAGLKNGAFVCGKCGDGICGVGENQCNCSVDCKLK